MEDSNHGQYGRYAQYDQYGSFLTSSSNPQNFRPTLPTVDTSSSSSFVDQNFNSTPLGSVYSSSLSSSFTTPMSMKKPYNRSLDDNDGDSNICNDNIDGSGTNSNKGSTTFTTNTNITEFTKRKNWSQRIVDEIRDFLHVLSPTGKLLYCGPSTSELVGYTAEEMIGRNIVDFLHLDDIDMFIREFKLAINTRSQLKVHYRFRKKNEDYIIFEIIGSPYFLDNVAKCFFAIGRPYLTKTTNLLDSFLEEKMENERLLRKICQLRLTPYPGNATIITPSFSSLGESSSSSGLNSSDLLSLPVNEVHSSHQKYFDHSHFPSESSILPSLSVQQQQKRQSQDKQRMAMVNTQAQIPSAIFNAFHYRDEERAHESSNRLANAQLQAATSALADLGVFSLDMGKKEESASSSSSQSSSPSTVSSSLLVNESNRPYNIGDGFGTTKSSIEEGFSEGKLDKKKTVLTMAPSEKRSAKKDDDRLKPRKKKLKLETNYVCTDCGRTESPEWRKGPTGKKTLCNACGLRWAKKNKKVPTDLNLGDEL